MAILPKTPNHYVKGRNMFGGYPDGAEQIMVGMGCFWGVERLFWQLDGVYVTSVGYAGGTTDNPDYKSVCTGRTHHAEVVHIVYDPDVMSTDALLKVFFENHDPTRKHYRHADQSSQYRGVIYTYTDAQLTAARAAKARYGKAYADKNLGAVTTEIEPAQTYYPAEDYHQQYMAKNPGGFCGIGGAAIVCPLPANG